MTTMASQITSLAVVYSIVYSDTDKKNIKAPRHWPLCGEFTGTGEFPAQRASYAENVSIWWRHHGADPQIARFTRSTWGSPGSCWAQVGLMLAPWTLLSGELLTIRLPFPNIYSSQTYSWLCQQIHRILAPNDAFCKFTLSCVPSSWGRIVKKSALDMAMIWRWRAITWAPNEKFKAEKENNPWITHDILKLMYERDYIGGNATQDNDPKLWQDYRNYGIL